MKTDTIKDNLHLEISPEIEALLNDPVYPTEEQLKDPRIQDLLNEDFH